MYFGAVSAVEQYFRQLGSCLPSVPVVNTADFVLEATARLPLNRETALNMSKLLMRTPCVVDLAEEVARHCDGLVMQEEIRVEKGADGEDVEWMPYSWQRRNVNLCLILLWRDFLRESRRAVYWAKHFTRCLALGLFLGNDTCISCDFPYID